MEYCLDVKRFRKKLVELGYQGVSEFAQKNNIHRNTLYAFFEGRDVFSFSFKKILKALAMDDALELMSPSSPIEASLDCINEIKPIVAKIIQKNKTLAVVLLGSRAQNKAKKYSDWDIGVYGYPEALSGRDYLRLKRMVDDASQTLVREVDLVNLNQAPLWFLEDMGGSIIFLDGNKLPFCYLEGYLHGLQKEKAA